MHRCIAQVDCWLLDCKHRWLVLYLCTNQSNYVFYMLFVNALCCHCGSVIGNYCTGDMCTYVQWNQPGELLVTSFLPVSALAYKQRNTINKC